MEGRVIFLILAQLITRYVACPPFVLLFYQLLFEQFHLLHEIHFLKGLPLNLPLVFCQFLLLFAYAVLQLLHRGL